MLNVKVEWDGEEPFEVEVKARDIAVWERAGAGRAFSNLRNGLKISELYEMTHVTLRREGLDRGLTLPQFEAVADVIPQKETADPTRLAASAAP